MKPAPTLRAVSNTPDPPIDITLVLRVDILSRDWSKMWVIADKAKAISIRDRGRWKWM